MVRQSVRNVLLAKSESIYGTDPTPTPEANAIAVIDAQIKETFEANDRGIQLATLSKKPSIGGMRYAEITFQAELMGSGAAGTAPKLGALFKACAMSESVAASSVVYSPASSPITSCTLYLYKDGVLHKVTGAVGSFKLTAEAGKIAMLDFSFKGIYNAPSDQSNPSPTFESTVDTPPTVVSAGFEYNSDDTLVIQHFMIDVANTIGMRPSINEAYGVKGFQIKDRKPNLEFDPEAQALSAINFRSDVMTNLREVVATVGSSSGNRCAISIPKFNLMSVEYGDRDGTLTEIVKGELVANSGSGDDEITLSFT